MLALGVGEADAGAACGGVPAAHVALDGGEQLSTCVRGDAWVLLQQVRHGFGGEQWVVEAAVLALGLYLVRVVQQGGGQHHAAQQGVFAYAVHVAQVLCHAEDAPRVQHEAAGGAFILLVVFAGGAGRCLPEGGGCFQQCAGGELAQAGGEDNLYEVG